MAEVPALQIADFGADVPEALDRLQAMVTFHLDCLREEGKLIPTEETEEAGFYLRVKLPPHAAWTAPSPGDHPQPFVSYSLVACRGGACRHPAPSARCVWF